MVSTWVKNMAASDQRKDESEVHTILVGVVIRVAISWLGSAARIVAAAVMVPLDVRISIVFPVSTILIKAHI